MPFPTFVEKLGSLSFLAIAKEGTYGATAGSTINSNLNIATTSTTTALTDPSGTYAPGSLIGRTITTTSGTNSGAHGIVTANTATVITVPSWTGGTPGNGPEGCG